MCENFNFNKNTKAPVNKISSLNSLRYNNYTNKLFIGGTFGVLTDHAYLTTDCLKFESGVVDLILTVVVLFSV